MAHLSLCARAGAVGDPGGSGLAARVGGQAFDGGGVGGRLGRGGEGLAVAERVERLVGRRRRRRRRARRAVRRAGRWRWPCPSRARARRARRSGRRSRPAPRRTGAATVWSRAPGAVIAPTRSPSAVRSSPSGSLRSGSFGCLAAVGGGEGGGPADHVLEHAAHGEVVAGRRVVELVGRDAGDHATEVGAELLELRDAGPWFLQLSMRIGRPRSAASRSRPASMSWATSGVAVGGGHAADHGGSPACRRRPCTHSRDRRPTERWWDEHPTRRRCPAAPVGAPGRCRPRATNRTIEPPPRTARSVRRGDRHAQDRQRDDRRARGGRHPHQGRGLGRAVRPPHRPPRRRRPPAPAPGAARRPVRLPALGLHPRGLDQHPVRRRHPDVNRAGDLYYWPGGHTGWTDEGVVFVEFSPADEIRPVLEHLGAQLAPSADVRAGRSLRWVGSAGDGAARRTAR